MLFLDKQIKHQEVNLETTSLSQTLDEAGKQGSDSLHPDDEIHLTFFAETCPFLSQILPTVQDRMFQAFGIDIGKKNASIKWE